MEKKPVESGEYDFKQSKVDHYLHFMALLAYHQSNARQKN